MLVYGADAAAVYGLAGENLEWAELLHPDLPYTGAEVVWAAQEEMSRTVDDALSRRTRAILLNAAAAYDVAPKVAKLLAAVLGRDQAWINAQVTEFQTLAEQYMGREVQPA